MAGNPFAAPVNEQDTLTELQRQHQASIFAPLMESAPMEEADPRPALKQAETVWDGWVSGVQLSTAGLLARGKSPEMIIGEDSTRAQRLAHLAGMVVGDLPTLVAGAAMFAPKGAPGGPIGAAAFAGAGAFAFTEGVRTWALEHYDKGFSNRTVAERLAATAWAMTKGAAIGGATGAAGAKVGQVMEGANVVTRFGAVTSAELATMVTVSHALEGELPTADSFIEAAIVLGGLKAAVGVSARLKHIYARTGVKPDQVVADAKKDSKLWRDLLDDKIQPIPDAYRARSESPISAELALLHKRLSETGEAPKAEVFQLLENPFAATIAQKRGREHLNLERLDLADGPKALLDELTRIHQHDMLQAQRGPVPWRQSDAEAMGFIRDVLGQGGLDSLTARVGTENLSARLNAARELLQMTLNDAWSKAAAVSQKGAKATPEDLLGALAAAERARATMLAFRGETAEVGRALNLLKKPYRAEEAKAREAEILELLKAKGGEPAVRQMTDILSQLRDPAAVGNALRKETPFEIFVEGWKSLLLSGPTTQQVNFLGNIFFALTRVPKEVAAATWSKLTPGSAERANYSDAIALSMGLARGSVDAVRAAGEAIRLQVGENNSFAKGVWEAYKAIDNPRKAELAVSVETPGTFRQIINAPLRALTLTDMLGRAMNKEATLAAEASRMALREGKTPMSREYFERVNELTKNPSKEMLERADADALRYVFLEDGPIIAALQNIRSDLPFLQFVIPFLKAPGGIIREAARMTPLAPAVQQWRADYMKGGVARDRALAEVSMGMALAVTAFMLAQEGIITGGGHPDPKQRRADLEAGVQPYSLNLGGNYISYNRWEPASTIIGLAADLSTAWELMDSGEQDKAASALMWGATEVVRNKTWLKSLVAAMNAITDPARHGQGWAESMAGTIIPGFVGQFAREFDPYVRDIDSILDAVQSRIPGLRQQLPIQYDSYGQPIRRAEGAWPFSPSTVKPQSLDKVRTEAARLGVSAGDIPRSLAAGSFIGQQARIDLTDEQREMFATESGQLAYDILSRTVNSAGWDNMHPLQQRRFYERVFAMSRRKGAIMALPPEQRAAAIEELREEHGF